MGEEAPTGMEGFLGNSPHRPATTVCLLLFPFLPLPVLMIGKTFTSFQLQNYIQVPLGAKRILGHDIAP